MRCNGEATQKLMLHMNGSRGYDVSEIEMKAGVTRKPDAMMTNEMNAERGVCLKRAGRGSKRETGTGMQRREETRSVQGMKLEI